MMIPEGRYKARGCEAKLAYTSAGAGQVAVDLVITEEESEYCGQHRTWYGSFTDKSTDRTLQSLRLLGWDSDDLSQLTGIDQHDVWVTIAHEEYEGEIRDRAAFINASAGLAVKTPMEEGDAKAFAERMKGHVLAHKAKSGGGSPNAKPAAPAAAPSSTSPAATGGKRKGAAAANKNDFAPDQTVGGEKIPF
jgi:hypothetical protein